jgi:hypothetical protein
MEWFLIGKSSVSRSYKKDNMGCVHLWRRVVGRARVKTSGAHCNVAVKYAFGIADDDHAFKRAISRSNSGSSLTVAR